MNPQTPNVPVPYPFTGIDTRRLIFDYLNTANPDIVKNVKDLARSEKRYKQSGPIYWIIPSSANLSYYSILSSREVLFEGNPHHLYTLCQRLVSMINSLVKGSGVSGLSPFETKLVRTNELHRQHTISFKTITDAFFKFRLKDYQGQYPWHFIFYQNDKISGKLTNNVHIGAFYKPYLFFHLDTKYFSKMLYLFIEHFQSNPSPPNITFNIDLQPNYTHVAIGLPTIPQDTTLLDVHTHRVLQFLNLYPNHQKFINHLRCEIKLVDESDSYWFSKLISNILLLLPHDPKRVYLKFSIFRNEDVFVNQLDTFLNDYWNIYKKPLFFHLNPRNLILKRKNLFQEEVIDSFINEPMHTLNEFAVLAPSEFINNHILKYPTHFYLTDTEEDVLTESIQILANLKSNDNMKGIYIHCPFIEKHGRIEINHMCHTTIQAIANPWFDAIRTKDDPEWIKLVKK